MSDWKKRNDDWRDEDELEEEEECECPWVDSKGKVRETAYCQYFLEKHPMMCLKQKLFDQNGEVDEDALLYEVHSDLRDFVLDNLAKKEKQVLDALRIETYTPEWKPQLDRIHLQNGTYFLDERGFVPEKELCLNRLPVEYQPDAPAPTKWLEFLDGLLIPEDILTLQEYLGYLLIPSTKAQKMLVMTGKGGEGKSRIGLLLKKLFGEASHSESILRIETNRFASANLEYKLVMVDDDLNMVALPETRNIKSIVTAEDRLCIERKNKQAVQGLLYVRFICFGNGNLVAAHDDSDGFWRRQILITVKDRDPARVDNPFLIEELSEERPGILLWMLEGLHRLLANRYQFTISERSIQNLEAAMADSDNLTQFMQATAYVRFKPDTEERSTYLYRAYTKWCEDNLESPVPQKKFSQFLLKNAGKYGLTFSKHIKGKFAFVKRSEAMKSPVGTLSDRTVLCSKMEGLCPDKFAFVKRSETMKSPVGTLSDRTVLRKQDGGALPRQVLRLPGRMRPPRLCCGIKHTKSENLPPYAPQSICFYLLSLFSLGACPPLPGGCRAAKRPSGRERNQDAPQEGACIPAMRPVKTTQKGTFV